MERCGSAGTGAARGTARRRAACPEEQETGKGGEPDADTLQGFRQRPRQARAAVQARAEAYTGILETVERLGKYLLVCAGKKPAPGLGGVKEKLCEALFQSAPERGRIVRSGGKRRGSASAWRRRAT